MPPQVTNDGRERRVQTPPPPRFLARPRSPSSQFAATPRFAIGTPRTRLSPPKPALLQAFCPPALRLEDVEEASVADDEGEILDPGRPTSPQTEQPFHAGFTELPFSPKRRRVDATADDAAPLFIRPTRSLAHSPPPARRFTARHSTVDSSEGDSVEHQRPAFLPAWSGTHPENTAEPLPEAFSPHRRGPKFVPGGLATTAQQWILETGQAASRSRRDQAYLRGEGFVAKFIIDDLSGSGPFLTMAKFADGERLHVLLAGAGGSQMAEPSVGSFIGVRAPMWDVEIDGTRWTVGVDWKVLS